MPTLPFLVEGTVYDTNGIFVANATVTVSITSGSTSVYTDSTGNYIVNLADIGDWSVGDTVTVLADKESIGTKTETFTISGGGKNLNLTLVEGGTYTEDVADLVPLRKVIVTDFDANDITRDNPFPVTLSKIPNSDDSKVITYDSSNNPIRIDMTVGGITYRRTITYDSNNNPTSVSAWERV